MVAVAAREGYVAHANGIKAQNPQVTPISMLATEYSKLLTYPTLEGGGMASVLTLALFSGTPPAPHDECNAKSVGGVASMPYLTKQG